MSKCNKCDKIMNDHTSTLDHLYKVTNHVGGLLTVYDNGEGVVTVIVLDCTDFKDIMGMLQFATMAVHRMQAVKPEPMQ